MSNNSMQEMFLTLGKNLNDEEFQLAVLQGLIAAEISMKRQELGLSQQQLSDKLGVSQALVSRWENGDCNFTLSTLVKISSALGLSIQSPIAPALPLCYANHGDKIISFSLASRGIGSSASTSYHGTYTTESDLDLKEN